MVIKNFLNLKGHQNRIFGSKVTDILVKRYILPIGAVASGRVCVKPLFQARESSLVPDCLLIVHFLQKT